MTAGQLPSWSPIEHTYILREDRPLRVVAHRRDIHGQPGAPLRLIGGAGAGSAAPLMMPKVRIPPPGRGMIARPRLITQLARGMQQALTLVIAPAGYGKTTLLSAWARQAASPVAWVSLEAADAMPDRFWAYVIAALDAAQPGVGAPARALLGTGTIAIEQVLVTLINTLATAPPIHLVLDAYDVIDADAIHHSLAFLLDHLPDTLHIALGVGTAAAAKTGRHAAFDIAANPASAAQVSPGGSFTDTFVISNLGDSPATKVSLMMSFDPAVVQLQGVQFNRANAWVTATMPNAFQAYLDRLDSHGDSVSITATFTAQPGYASGTPLAAQASVTWRDRAGSSGNDLINTPLLVAASGQMSNPSVSSSGGMVQVTGAGFSPGDAIAFWYNLPDGTALPLYIRSGQLVTDKTRRVANKDVDNGTLAYADASGQISIGFDATGLAPGAYSIVAHGTVSGVNNVTSFQM